jgi:diamine N-acetyltransferase
MLKSQDIQLRAIEPSDLDFIYILENDPEVWQVGNTLIPYSKYQIEQYVLSTQHDLFSEKQMRLMIDRVLPGPGNIPIGAVDLYDFDPYHKRAGVGIILIPEERGKGIAQEALSLLVRYCFEILDLHQLFCSITEGNIPSIRLFEQCGFIQCGTRKEWRFLNGTFMDELMFQLIKK